MDILDRRKFPSSAADLVLFGVEDIKLLTAHYGARPMFENGATVLAEWETYKSIVAGRPEGESFPDTYSFIVGNGAFSSMPAISFTLSVKLILPFATAEAERGFSCMTRAKGAEQAQMKTPILGSRIMIQLNGPAHPRNLGARSPEVFDGMMKIYDGEVAALLKASIKSWGLREHTSLRSAINTQNGRQKRGSTHGKGRASAPPDALAIVAGTAPAVAVFAKKVRRDAPGDGPSPPLPEEKPKYECLEDAICVAPEPNLEAIDVSSLERNEMALLFEIKNAYGQVINWEWFKGSIQKAKRVANQVTVEVKFSDGKRDVVLSTLAYNTDWVLLCEKKEGAAAGKKRKKQTSKKLGANAPRAH